MKTTTTYDKKNDDSKFEDLKVKSKEGKGQDLYEEIMERMNEMKLHRSISCPYQTWNANWQANNASANGLQVGGGYDWADFWDQSMRLYRRQRKMVKGRANLKSSIIFANVEAFMSEVQENEVGVLYTSDNDEKREKIKMYKYLDKTIEHKNRFPQARKASWKTAAICGTAITYTGVVFEKHIKEVVLDKKELEEERNILLEADSSVIDSYDEASKTGMPRTRKDERVNLRFIRENVPLKEMYFSPDATCVNGQANESEDAFRERRPGCENIKAKLLASEDPYLDKKIIKELRPAKDVSESFDTGRSSLFQYTEDLGTNKVLMREYWNEITDRYIIIINDAIVREGPLPYNHGKIPFQVHQFFKDEENVYGFGFGWVLMDLQAEKDATINQQIESVQRARGNWFFDTSIDSDMDRFNTNDSEQKIGFDADGRSIESVLKYIRPETYSIDRADLINYFDSEEIKLSGINPVQYSMPTAGEPVRNNMMASESSQRNIQKNIENWAEGEIEHKRQLLGKNGLVRQYVTEDRLKDGTLDDIKDIRMDGVKLEPIWKKVAKANGYDEIFKGFEEKRIVGESSLELIADYIDNDTDIDFIATIDTWLPESKSLRISNVKDMSASLSERLMDPNILMNPFQVELIRAEIEEVSPPNKDRLLDLLPSANDDDEEERAAVQNELIEKLIKEGELNDDEKYVIDPKQGESKSHINYHALKISQLSAELRSLKRQLELPLDIDPANLSEDQKKMIMAEAQSSEARIEEIGKILDELIDHIAIDEQPAAVNTTAIVEGAMREIQPPEQIQDPNMQEQVPPEMQQGLPPEQQIGIEGGQAPMMPLPI